MAEHETTWDHSKADRPYLRGYAFALLRLGNQGERQLASMIANAENAQELLNYDGDMVCTATRAVLTQDGLGSPYAPDHAQLWKLAKTLARQPVLFKAFVDEFSDRIGPEIQAKSGQPEETSNKAFLEQFAKAFPDTAAAIGAAYSAATEPRPTKKARLPEPSPAF